MQSIWRVAFGVGMVSLAAGLAVMPSCETVNGVQQDMAPVMAQVSPTPTPAPKAQVTFASEPDIRVRVVKAAVKKEIGGPATLIVRPLQTSSSSKSKVLPTPLTITTGPGGVSIVDGTGATTKWAFGTDLEVLAEGADGLKAQSIKVDKQVLPGYVTVKPGWTETSTRFDIIATMPIETYLPGVVTGELLKDWPRQTNEAQAVAARTYALHERARARAEGRRVDVENTTDDQVYSGLSSPVALEAVRATRGMVMVSEGKLIRAYFSSCCGGRPSSAADIWPKTDEYAFNRAAPLQGKQRQSWCQPSPLYRWEVTRSDDDVNRRLRAWGKATHNPVASIARLRSVAIDERNDAQRPNHYKLTDDRGQEYTLKAEELRMALNQAVSDLPPITRENRVNSGDLQVEVWAKQVKIQGRGWGHGVGMCQWCAKGMAEQGMDWHTMLTTFYPGVEIQRAY